MTYCKFNRENKASKCFERASKTAKYTDIVFVCVKGGGHKACADERTYIKNKYGGWTGPGGFFDSFFSGVSANMEVWNYSNGQIANKFGLDPNDYYNGEADDDTDDDE